MTFTDITSLAIVGAFVSVITQLIKAQWATDGWKTRGVLILISVFGGAIFYFLSNTIYWQAVLGVLAVANTIYGFIIRPLEQK